MQSEPVTVISRKYDLSIRRSWRCKLVEQSGSLLVLLGDFHTGIEHPDLGLIQKGTVSREYYWLDRWYNVFRFEHPDGRFRNFYCNINTPPTFENGVLDYVDLDLDLIVWPDGNVVVLDEKDFAENAAKFDYPNDVRANALKALDELKRMIEDREFPFDSF
ncbi:MAG: hypothetical protein DMF62_10110 [Acidobacteria bacterium]|nr:MAG: hypothetical protein DMF62_10110 [Acidobacteriota bacterium]